LAQKPIATRDRKAKSRSAMSIQRRITAMAALAALMLGASAVPASARPFDLDGNGSFVPAQTATNSSTSVPPSPPSLKASVIAMHEQEEQRAVADTPPTGARHSNAKTNASATTAKRHISSGVAGAATPQTGFDWGDAGIGAAAGFMLAMLALSAALMISHRRPRPSRHTTALTS
jgi:hypothetical protein